MMAKISEIREGARNAPAVPVPSPERGEDRRAANVVPIWNPRALRRGLQRHWVRFNDEMVIYGERPGRREVLSLARLEHDGMLVATLTLESGQLAQQIDRGGKLVMRIRDDWELILAVRAVDGDRALVEFAMPQGSRTRIAISG